jgi:PAS domain S-box-containing protein
MTTHIADHPAARSDSSASSDSQDGPVPQDRRWYILGAVSTLAALIATVPIRMLGGDTFYGTPFFLAAVMFISWYGGFLPGLLTTALSVAAISVFFVPPLAPSIAAGSWHMATFGIVALSIHAFSFWRARSEARLKEIQAKLLTANEATASYLSAERDAREAAEVAHYRIGRVQAVTAALSRAVTPAEVAEAVVNQGAAAMGAWAGSIAVFDREAMEVVVLAHTGYRYEDLQRFRRLPLSAANPVTEAIRTGKLLLYPSTAELLSRFPDLAFDDGSKAWAAVPLVQNDMVIGAMGLSFRDERGFEGADIEMMQVLANQCAQAFERARLYQSEQQARHAAERLSYRTARLQAATAALSGARTPAEVAEVVVDEGVAALGADSGFLLMFGRTSAEIVGGRGYSREVSRKWRSFSLEGMSYADPASFQEPTFHESREEFLKRFPHLAPVIDETGDQAIAALPLLSNGRFLGILSISFRTPRPFSAEERELMKAFANQAVQALERARLYERERNLRTAAQQAEERYRVLAEAIPALVLLSDADGRSVYQNQQFIDYIGKPPERLRRWEWWRMMHPQDRRQATKRWLQTLRDGHPVEHEFRIRRYDGEYRWHFGRSIPIKNEDGSVRLWLGFSIEIEERKRAEEAVRQSEERYRTLAESMPALVAISNTVGGIEYTNRPLLEYANVTPEEIQGVGWTDLVHPDDVPGLAARWQECLGTGETLEYEARVLRADGQFRWHSMKAIPVLDADGKPVKWIGVSTDIEDVKQGEERERFLSAATAVLSSSLDYGAILRQTAGLMVPQIADVASIYAVENGVISLLAQEVAPEAEELRRTQDSEGTARTDSRHHVAVAIATGESQFSPGDAADGSSEGDLAFLVVPFKARDGALGAIALEQCRSGRKLTPEDQVLVEELARRLGLAVENVRLYSESQEAREKLRQANEAKDEFLGLMSHELRTPTTSIYGGVRVLRTRDRQLSSTDREELLEDMELESERLFRMIEDLLSLARLEDGGSVPTEPLRLQHVIPKIVRGFRHKRAGRRIVIHADTSLPLVASESTYLEQIMRNLLSNADKYSPPSAPLEVEVSAGDDYALVAVLDRGPGVAEEDMSAIFDKFYRSEATLKQARGVGLGLTVCKRLIEAQSGRIWAEPRLGGGLAVKFSLPYYQEVME